MSELVLPLPGRVRRAFGWAAYLRFVLFQSRRHDRLVLENVAGFPVVVLPHVFNPKLFRTGELLACLREQLENLAGGDITRRNPSRQAKPHWSSRRG